jgi:carbonic anhydrase
MWKERLAATVSAMSDFTPSTDELIGLNAEFAANFSDHDLQVAPMRMMAVVACMDSRMDTFKLLGLENGEAHIIRNAGGIVSDDVIRSLCLSQRALGTREIVLVHHTDCGLQKVTDDGFRNALEAELGVKPWWAVESFVDPYADVRQSMQRLHVTPFVDATNMRGFVYNVTTGMINEVALD